MPGQDNYQWGAIPLDLVDYVTKKTVSSRSYFRYLLNRTLMMFKYDNLPKTIDSNMLERYLQMNGFCCITEAKGNLYAFNGSWGGEQDVYYRPTKFIIANPHISQLTDDKTFTKEVIIYGDQEHTGVLMRNDFEWHGLSPMIARYATLFTENCVTVRTADIMLRILALLSASSDKAKKSAEAYLKKLEAGELGVIADTAFMESLKMQSPPSNNGSYLTQFIELQQYLKGSFYNELGLRANYNMKREAIGEGESTLDTDALLPLCQCMLQCRREDIAKVNELFGTNITVEFNSAWLQNEVETSLSLVSQLAEISNTSAGGVGNVGANCGVSGANGGDDVDDIEGGDGDNAESEQEVEDESTGGGSSTGSDEGAGGKPESGENEEEGENGGGDSSGSSGEGDEEARPEEEGKLDDVVSQLTDLVAEQVKDIMDDPTEGGAENGVRETQDPED